MTPRSKIAPCGNDSIQVPSSTSHLDVHACSDRPQPHLADSAQGDPPSSSSSSHLTHPHLPFTTCRLVPFPPSTRFASILSLSVCTTRSSSPRAFSDLDPERPSRRTPANSSPRKILHPASNAVRLSLYRFVRYLRPLSTPPSLTPPTQLGLDRRLLVLLLADRKTICWRRGSTHVSFLSDWAQCARRLPLATTNRPRVDHWSLRHACRLPSLHPRWPFLTALYAVHADDSYSLFVCTPLSDILSCAEHGT